MRVVSAFPSPLGLGLFQFDDPIQRERLISASPIQFGHGHIRVLKHDEARNFRSCVYSRESWIMFLGFPLDYQLPEFVKAVVAPFGHLLSWLEGPNKSRVLTKCLLLEPARVPKNLIVPQDTLLGGTSRSWTVLAYILDGHFPNAFPQDEDPAPLDGNPHPDIGPVQNANPNAPQGWEHDLPSAAEHVNNDFGLNAAHMEEVQNDLAVHQNEADGQGCGA